MHTIIRIFTSPLTRKLVFSLLLGLTALFFIAPLTRQMVFSEDLDCGVLTRNPWCTGGCCRGTNKVWRLNGCSWTPYGYCREDWNKQYVVSCPDPGGTCLTELWDQGRCRWTAASCYRDAYWEQSNCCSGPPEQGGGGGGRGGSQTPQPIATATPSCTTWFDPPFLDEEFAYTPPHPLTIGQDPDDLGVEVSLITALGGARHCPEEGFATIVSFVVEEVVLADSSTAWINGELARKYPGARVKGSYPFTPRYLVSGIGTETASLSLHLDPLDPGWYEIHVLVVQEDGQSLKSVFRVPVYLLESTLIP